MPAKGTDLATLTNWWRDLTFKEVHAMTYGVTHGVGVVVAHYLGYQPVALALVIVAFILNGWLGTEKTEGAPIVRSIYETLPDAIVGQIRDELHYYDGALLAGVAISIGVLYGIGI